MKQQNTKQNVRSLFIDELMEIDGGQSTNGLSGNDEDVDPLTTTAIGEEQE